MADNHSEKRGIWLSRILAGTFMISLDGPGFSITLLKADTQILKCIDEEVIATGWVAPRFPGGAWANKSLRVVDNANLPIIDGIETGGELKRKSLLAQAEAYAE